VTVFIIIHCRVFSLRLKILMFFWLVTKIDEHEISNEGNYWLINTINKKGIFPMLVNSYLHFVVVLFVIMTNVAKICSMEENITLIMHHGGDLERDEYQRLQYVDGEFCVWEKVDVDELCLRGIEKMVKHCRGCFKVSKLW